MKKKLIFISRHKPNDGQIALVKKMGYSGIEQKNINFSSDPVKDLKEAGITEKTIAIVAPQHVCNILLNAGYTLITFVNSPIKREKMVFCCEGAYKSYLSLEGTGEYTDPFIDQTYIQCPISIDDQYESSLI